MDKTQQLAADAHGILESPAFKAAFKKIRSRIEREELTCDLDHENLKNLILLKRTLLQIERELKVMFQSGIIHDHNVNLNYEPEENPEFNRGH